MDTRRTPREVRSKRSPYVCGRSTEIPPWQNPARFLGCAPPETLCLNSGSAPEGPPAAATTAYTTPPGPKGPDVGIVDLAQAVIAQEA